MNGRMTKKIRKESLRLYLLKPVEERRKIGFVRFFRNAKKDYVRSRNDNSK